MNLIRHSRRCYLGAVDFAPEVLHVRRHQHHVFVLSGKKKKKKFFEAFYANVERILTTVGLLPRTTGDTSCCWRAAGLGPLASFPALVFMSRRLSRRSAAPGLHVHIYGEKKCENTFIGGRNVGRILVPIGLLPRTTGDTSCCWRGAGLESSPSLALPPLLL